MREFCCRPRRPGRPGRRHGHASGLACRFQAAGVPRIPSLHRDAVQETGPRFRHGGIRRLRRLHPRVASRSRPSERQGARVRSARRPGTGVGQARGTCNLPRASHEGLRPLLAGESGSRLGREAAARRSARLELPGRPPSPEPGRAAPCGRGRRASWTSSASATRSFCVESPVWFEHLIIPDAGYKIQKYFHPAHAEFLAVVPHEPVPGRKLWLSRSKLPFLQNKSMPAVESRLADLGWTIIYPETLSISEQMANIATSERIAGEQGSALHSIIFLDGQEI